MSLTVTSIVMSGSDDDLLRQLSHELQRLLPREVQDDYELLVPAMRRLPRGLRAMASTHRLDVSMAVDDLGWHFFNFHHCGLCDEIQWGLRELEAIEAAQVFESARALVQPHWDEIGRMKANGPKVFANWYPKSGVEKLLTPLNHRLWDVCNQSTDHGLMQYWLNYARKYPARVLEIPDSR